MGRYLTPSSYSPCIVLGIPTRRIEEYWVAYRPAENDFFSRPFSTAAIGEETFQNRGGKERMRNENEFRESTPRSPLSLSLESQSLRGGINGNKKVARKLVIDKNV